MADNIEALAAAVRKQLETPVSNPNEEVFQVPPEVAVQMKILEYDKQITDAEANAAYLKHQRNMYIWDNNMQAIRAKYKK
jgi:hypothetical protein